MKTTQGRASHNATGAVLLLGSLFWEGNNLDQDGSKGRERNRWRQTALRMDAHWEVNDFPIRYCRRSESASPYADQRRRIWRRDFARRGKFEPQKYHKFLNKDGFLNVTLSEAAWNGLDYCLATATKPKPSKKPSAKQIADAVNLGSYFRRTYDSGIRTSDDKAILAYLREGSSEKKTRKRKMP